MSYNVDDLFDDPDFVGLVWQSYHVAGDERQPAGNPIFVPRGHDQGLIERWLRMGGEVVNADVYPVFRRPTSTTN